MAVTPVLDDVLGRAADKEDRHQAEEEADADVRELGDPLHPEPDRQREDHRDEDQHDNRQVVALGEACHLRQRRRQKGGRGREGGGGRRQQPDNREEVDDFPERPVDLFPEDRPAGLAHPLAGGLADMHHIAVGRRREDVEGPGDRAPVEEGVGARPVLFLGQGHPLHRKRGFVIIVAPLAEGPVEDVGRHRRGEDHRPPR